jgi:hypothetical protein
MDEVSPWNALCLPSILLTASTSLRSFRRILLIPSWEGRSADPEEKPEPCERHQNRIGGKSLTRLTPYAPIEKAFPWASAPTYLVRDNDRAYGHVFLRRVRAMGIRDRPISPGSPWQNGIAERLIGTLRRECLDHMVIFGEAHLRRILSGYAAYYNHSRTHLALQKNVPLHRAVQRSGAIVAIPILAGLHHRYVRI